MSLFFSSDVPQAQKPFSVAVVHSEFNETLTEKLVASALKGLKKCGIDEKAVEMFSVPGTLELPFAAKKIMETTDFDGILALGVVIRGETRHFEIVAHEASRGIMNLNLEGQVPVINGILATENEEQAVQRLERGVEFAKSLVQMMNLNLSFGKDDSDEI